MKQSSGGNGRDLGQGVSCDGNFSHGSTGCTIRVEIGSEIQVELGFHQPRRHGISRNASVTLFHQKTCPDRQSVFSSISPQNLRPTAVRSLENIQSVHKEHAGDNSVNQDSKRTELVRRTLTQIIAVCFTVERSDPTDDRPPCGTVRQASRTGASAGFFSAFPRRNLGTGIKTTVAPSTIKPSATKSEALHFNETGAGADRLATAANSGGEVGAGVPIASSARRTQQARTNSSTTQRTTA